MKSVRVTFQSKLRAAEPTVSFCHWLIRPATWWDSTSGQSWPLLEHSHLAVLRLSGSDASSLRLPPFFACGGLPNTKPPQVQVWFGFLSVVNEGVSGLCCVVMHLGGFPHWTSIRIDDDSSNRGTLCLDCSTFHICSSLSGPLHLPWIYPQGHAPVQITNLRFVRSWRTSL